MIPVVTSCAASVRDRRRTRNIAAIENTVMSEPSPAIESWNAGRDGPLTEAGLRRKLELRGCQVSRHVYPPGTVFPAHSHGVDKIDAVLSGRFRMTLGGYELVPGPGDCLAAPKGARHAAAVVGHEPVVSLDAVRR
jgi:quercetin dioxygenase-like cupin family protein